MLPLDSPRWSKLQSSVGNGVEPAKDLAELKSSLAQALSQTTDVDFAQLIDQFGYIFEDLDHQQSTYPATTAAMPHFVQIAEGFPVAERIQALSFISTMHYDAFIIRTDEPDLLEWYRASISKAKNLNLAILIGEQQLNFDQQISSLESHYIFNGNCHYMFREHDWFEYPCPKCNQQLFASLIENEFLVWPAEDGYDLKDVLAERKSQVVPAANIDVAIKKPENGELQDALTIARDGNHLATIDWLRRLTGASPCPVCNEQIRLAYNDFWFDKS